MLDVIVVIGILISIAVPAVGHLINKAEADVCDVNRSEIDMLYQDYLVLDGSEHSDVLFVEFLERFEDTCRVGGSVLYCGLIVMLGAGVLGSFFYYWLNGGGGTENDF